MKHLLGLIAIAAFATSAMAQDQSAGPQIYYQIDGFEKMDAQTQKELTKMAERYVQVAVDNYPLILDTLKVDGRQATARTVLIELSPDYNGIAEESGDGAQRTIKINDDYARKGRDDVGVIVHEMTHVVQSYFTGDHPTWLGEGIADYVRWFRYEPKKKRPQIKPSDADAKGSYQTTAAFLYWAARKYDDDLVPKLNWALHRGVYDEQIFYQITGHSLDELNNLWRKSLEK